MIINVGNTVAFGGLTLGQTDSNGIEWYWLDIDGWGATKSTSTPTQRTTADGATAPPAYKQYRTVTVTGAFLAPTVGMYVPAQDILHSAASILPQQITVLDSGTSRWVSGQRQDEVLWKRQSDVSATFTAVFFCIDQRKFGTAVTLSTALPSSVGGRTYPATYPVTYSATQVTGIVTISNPGNAKGKLTLRISGPCVGPSVTHLGTGTVLTFASSLTLNAGEYLDVDMDNHKVLANGQSSRNNTVTSRGWFGLDPGDNQFAFNAVAYNAASQLTVTGTPAWD